MLGLNDIVYVVPEFNPSEYREVYPDSAEYTLGHESFSAFFQRYQRFRTDPNPQADQVPGFLKDLDKNLCSAIERDRYQPDLRGQAMINLKNTPNGHYSIYYLRIGQPLSIHSRLKVLGKAKRVFVNFNRLHINETTQPQLDLVGGGAPNPSPSTPFGKIKAQQSRDRDNLVLNLNSDLHPEDEDEPRPAEDSFALEPS